MDISVCPDKSGSSLSLILAQFNTITPRIALNEKHYILPRVFMILKRETGSFGKKNRMYIVGHILVDRTGHLPGFLPVQTEITLVEIRCRPVMA